jgi:PAS domain S-box-containing protein
MSHRILIIDDDQQVLGLASALLRRQGYECALAPSTTEARKLLETESFQLVLTDYMLGDGTGEDVVLAAKRSHADLPVLMMSGDCSQIPEWLVSTKIVEKVLPKPFNVRQLLDSIDEALNRRAGMAQPPPHQPLAELSMELPKGIEEIVHRVVDRESIIAITNKAGVIVYANDRFCEISGYRRSELIGQNHRILKSGEHPHSFYKHLWGTILGGKTWQGEICNRAKDGRLYYVDTTIAPLRTEGLITHFLAIRTDITARREAQLELAAEGRRREADLRMVALGRMADGVLHDLSNILTGMMGIAAETEVAGRNKVLQDSISRMAQLTRTLRDYSTGRPTESEPFALNSVVSCACSLVRHRKGAPAGMKIHEDTGSTAGVRVLGNEGQVFEVVLNLLVNAMEAAKDSSPCIIRVNTTHRDGTLCVRVEDNGPGVPAGMIPVLFEPYASSKGRGRGIGLSAAHSIAAAHSGELRLAEAGGQGRGACFELSLPSHQQLLPDQVGAKTTDPTQTKRVVLVSEDETEVRRTITQELGKAGLTVISAGDPADLLALAATMKEVLAAAILDSCELESDNGAVACLRRVSPGLKIICISASMPTKGKFETPWGLVDSMPKPFEAEKLLELLSLPDKPSQ